MCADEKVTPRPSSRRGNGERKARSHKQSKNLSPEILKRTMKGYKPMKKITDITYPGFALIAFVCLALCRKATAVCQEGCLRNDTPATGRDAIINTTGSQNTAHAIKARFSNTIGNSNTATGWE